eukprot:9586331-Prorocentrum_lima.AAC.1
MKQQEYLQKKALLPCVSIDGAPVVMGRAGGFSGQRCWLAQLARREKGPSLRRKVLAGTVGT